MINVAIVITGFIAGLVLTGRLARSALHRVDIGSEPNAQIALVSIIIPARNEASSLPHLLASLHDVIAAGSTPIGIPVEILVIDDNSTDDTAAIGNAAGVTVVAAGEPPTGWVGKTWACHRGSEVAAGQLLIFLDADVRASRHGVEQLIMSMASTTGLVSVQPYHDTVKVYEELSAYFNVVSVMAIGAFTVIPRIQPTGAFGPCIATWADEYHSIGGHRAIRSEILDDVSLAQLYRQAGSNVRCVNGRGAFSYRMYPGGVRQLIEGWSKNIAIGARTTSWWLSVTTAMWITAHAVVAVEMIRGVIDWSVEAHAPYWQWAAWVTIVTHLWWILRQIGSFNPLTALLYPIALTWFIVIFFRSLFLAMFTRRVTWKGRTIDV